ncbi:MAG: hypothetical protein JST08_03020 [Actinobacteria bacterium]|nr:hypothetical protein [Actinomycetota bacterium]
MSRLRGRLTYANVTATLSLFLLLAGGSAVAARQMLPKNTVGTAQIKNGAVTGAKIRNGAVTGAKVQVATLGTVPNAGHATSADRAVTADRAVSADRAVAADRAVSADRAASADHATSADSAASAAALAGVPAARYLTNGSVLGAGETEVGGWGASGASGSFATAVIDFFPKLGREIPAADLVFQPVESSSANCPGPRQAAPGFLCIYAAFQNGLTFEGFRSAFSSSTAPAGPESVLMVFTSTASFGTARGSWAYQEP